MLSQLSKGNNYLCWLLASQAAAFHPRKDTPHLRLAPLTFPNPITFT